MGDGGGEATGDGGAEEADDKLGKLAGGDGGGTSDDARHVGVTAGEEDEVEGGGEVGGNGELAGSEGIGLAADEDAQAGGEAGEIFAEPGDLGAVLGTVPPVGRKSGIHPNVVGEADGDEVHGASEFEDEAGTVIDLVGTAGGKIGVDVEVMAQIHFGGPSG
jgi:hypothetical protein